MVSLVGIPPTAGFIAKYWMFGAAVKEGLYGLVVVAVLTSVISLFYYMNVVRVMMFHQPKDNSPIPLAGMVKTGLTLSVVMVLIICIWPGVFYNWAMSASTIFAF
jgi:NADH-quinone oxidoreductase subunit N